MNHQDLWRLGAVELADLMRRRVASALEAPRRLLARMELNLDTAGAVAARRMQPLWGARNVPAPRGR